LPRRQDLSASLVLVAQVLLICMVLLNFFFAVLGSTFMKLKYSPEFVRGTTVWHDMARVVLPDLATGARRWGRKLTCGLAYRNSSAPLTNRQLNRLVRQRALEGADIRPEERAVVRAVWVGRPRYADLPTLNAMLTAVAAARPITYLASRDGAAREPLETAAKGKRRSWGFKRGGALTADETAVAVEDQEQVRGHVRKARPHG
jgi:hypothetical protein